MTRALSLMIAIVCCGFLFTGCLKHGKNRTIDSNMSATVTKIGVSASTFSASGIESSLLTQQIDDTSTMLIMTGYNAKTGEKLTLTVSKYNEKTGIFSIADKQGGAVYERNGTMSIATSGLVAFKDVTSNSIIGYFSFTTADGYTFSSGEFVVGKPWNY